MSFGGIESQLINRLEAMLVEVSVLPISDFTSISEGTQKAKAVYVAYQGYNVTETRADGLAAQIEQTWLTVVVRRNVRLMTGAQPAREDAYQIMDIVFSALAGFQPIGASEPLRLTNAQEAEYVAGQAIFPMAWAVKTVLRGNP
jgi:hypothetical protein